MLWLGDVIIVTNMYVHMNLTGRGSSSGGIMVIVLNWSMVGRALDPWSGQSKDYKNWYLLLLCQACRIKEWEERLVGSVNNVLGVVDISQQNVVWNYKNSTLHICLVQNRYHHLIKKVTCSPQEVHKQQSLTHLKWEAYMGPNMCKHIVDPGLNCCLV